MENNRKEFIKIGSVITGGLATGIFGSFAIENKMNSDIVKREANDSLLVNCYYYAPHNHRMLSKHIEYDLEKWCQ